MSAPGEHFRGSLTVTVRNMRPSDAPALAAILKESPEAAIWSEGSLLESAQCGTAWVAEQEGHAVGLLIGRSVADEFEILNLAVVRSNRRRGIATRLLETVAAWTRTAGTARIYLEVRASNDAAMALYARHGFKSCGRRARYYQDPVEDAIVLSQNKDITP